MLLKAYAFPVTSYDCYTCQFDLLWDVDLVRLMFTKYVVLGLTRHGDNQFTLSATSCDHTVIWGDLAFCFL